MSLNSRQKAVLVLTALVVIGMFLYPPWHLNWKEGTVIGLGFGWLIDPPDSRATVDIGLLLTEWVGALVVGALLFWASMDSGDD